MSTARTRTLAIDYRLAPEHRREEALEDCHNAWQYMVLNGPDGAAPIHEGGEPDGISGRIEPRLCH